jgi:hypothetical protein
MMEDLKKKQEETYKAFETPIKKVNHYGEIRAINDQQEIHDVLICEKPDMTTVQDFQDDNSSLNETTNTGVEETGSVLNIHQDASKEDGMNTDSKDKETPVFTNSNKL